MVFWTRSQDVQEHLTDLFGVERKLEPSEIIEPETAGDVSLKVILPPEVRQKGADQNVADNSNGVEPRRLTSSRATIPFTYIGAALVLLIAMLLSIFFIFGGEDRHNWCTWWQNPSVPYICLLVILEARFFGCRPPNLESRDLFVPLFLPLIIKVKRWDVVCKDRSNCCSFCSQFCLQYCENASCYLWRRLLR